VGAVRTPPHFLRDGNELTTYSEGIGTMRHQLRSPSRKAHHESDDTRG
jgi:hypothetical protein